MDPILKILNYSFIFFSMFGIGLKVERGDIMRNLKDKALMSKSLIANFIIVPLIAVVLLKLLPLQQTAANAIMLLAITPGGLSALQFTTKAKETDSLAFAASLAFILSILSLVISPLLILLLRQREFDLNIPFGEFIFISLILILLPLLIGVFLGDKKDALASKLSKPVALIGTICFFAIIVYTFKIAKSAKDAIDGKTLVVILIFIVLSIITGWILGGPNSEKRRVLAAITSMRNFALALLLIQSTLPESGLDFPLTAFASIMVPPNMLIMLSYNFYMKRKNKKSKSE